MKIPLLDLKAQYRHLQPELSAAVQRVLDSQIGILGPEVTALEEAANRLLAPARCLGVSSGTDALLLALMALEIGPGDEVIVPPFTFFATAAVVLRVGAKPVFVDIQPDTYNIDPDLIEAAITPRTKAIIPVDLFGQCALYEHLQSLAQHHHLYIIEDACQALGAHHCGNPAGAFGDISCFSFYPTKNLGALGDAGMVATTQPELFEKCRILRNQGMEPRYYHHYIGGNFRMDAFQGAILAVKINYLTQWNQQRAHHADHYNRKLQQADIATPIIASGNDHIYHQYTIRTSRRDALRQYLNDAGIGSEIYYPLPLHHQPCLARMGYDQSSCPHSIQAAREVLSLPIYPEMSETQVDYVADKIIEFFHAST
ncbi:MAG: dTDP-3-amino-3,4,6-trideoxy-alpha-D-glucose transaminase [Phycisphaerae bacterium]|nr:dTDP-3-amino-3,4,6-trideoxy-alpha-D-glucose transaminase [Phycisphaerae bacterium]